MLKDYFKFKLNRNFVIETGDFDTLNMIFSAVKCGDYYVIIFPSVDNHKVPDTVSYPISSVKKFVGDKGSWEVLE